MINKEIKFYKNLVEVNITDFQGKLETLYWEGTVKAFGHKYGTLKAISFPIHGGRVIDMNRVMGFNNAKPNDITLELKISGLSSLDQETVKLLVKNYKTNYRKYPTEGWLNNVIDRIINPNKFKQLEIKKEKESDEIKNKKKNRINYYNSLSNEEKDKLECESWNLVFIKYPNFKGNKNDVKAKIKFIEQKNQLLDKNLI